ncbi:alpha/beta fold hydrolase [Mycobacterium terramassiliense]|uniref:Lysophospholipase, alpha-beta hydrolase superfamily n=1 Tax=Mycobacterium terramassiliense TaxID=1841859 RepID=A0A2U3NDQ5_9MYCO|nr:alpha/beta fold hydrolase [Mycobacterium terramassiliense]SPM29627.1 Lysophospholipase, alpha-beta hydrolase superfamily [Mycobacterium terramassiliense]
MADDAPHERLAGYAHDRVVSVDGSDIHVVENGPHSEPALLLIHGYAGSAAWWDRLVPRLAENQRVIRVDLLGHGGSAKPADGYTVAAQANMIASVLPELGVRTVIAVGHSTGGAIATALAEHARGAVVALALIDSGPSAHAYLQPGGLGRLISIPVIGRMLWALRSESTIRKGLGSAFTREVEIAPQIVADVRGMNHRAFTATPKETMKYLAQRSLPDRIGGLALPVLVIFGVEDRRWRSSSTAEYASVPNVAVELLPGVGHTPMLEEPGVTTDLVAGFVAKHCTGAHGVRH